MPAELRGVLSLSGSRAHGPAPLSPQVLLPFPALGLPPHSPMGWPSSTLEGPPGKIRRDKRTNWQPSEEPRAKGQRDAAAVCSSGEVAFQGCPDTRPSNARPRRFPPGLPSPPPSASWGSLVPCTRWSLLSAPELEAPAPAERRGQMTTGKVAQSFWISFLAVGLFSEQFSLLELQSLAAVKDEPFTFADARL